MGKRFFPLICGRLSGFIACLCREVNIISPPVFLTDDNKFLRCVVGGQCVGTSVRHSGSGARAPATPASKHQPSFILVAPWEIAVAYMVRESAVMFSVRAAQQVF